MELQYQLQEADFLTFQLYTASKNKRIVLQRRLLGSVIGVFTLLYGLTLLYKYTGGFKNGLLEQYWFDVGFWVTVGIFMLALYPIIVKNRQYNHYKRFVARYHAERVGIETSLEIGEECIQSSNEFSETKIKTSYLKNITALPEHIYLHFKMGDTLIIPSKKVKQYDELSEYLEQIASRYDIPFFKEHDWKW